jgi:hypothetical protein
MLPLILARNRRPFPQLQLQSMPIQNDRRQQRRWSVVLLLLAASFIVPAAASAAEVVTRACDEMSFKAIAQMMDAASNFETRLVLLGKRQLPDNQGGSTANDMEAVNIGTLRNSLGEVWGYLLASENLAAVRDLTVDERDRATLDRQLKLVAQQIQEPLSFGLESAENVSATTKRPGLAAEVAKIHDFMDQTRAQFGACAGRANR